MQFNLKNYIGINKTKLRRIDETKLRRIDENKSRDLGKKYDKLEYNISLDLPKIINP